MVAWNFFSKRRNINLDNLIKVKNFDKYEKLVEWCNLMRVQPPEESDYNKARVVAFPPPKNKPKPRSRSSKKTTPALKSAPAKKRTYRKKAATKK